MNNKEIAQQIVDRMMETIAKEGKLPWTQSWTTGHRSVEVIDGWTEITIPVTHWSRSGKAYQGINPMLLNFAGKSGEMITFNQCKAEGGRVKKGAKAATIVYWNMVKKETEDLDENGNKIVITIPCLKTFKVFSVLDDCEGLEEKHHPEPVTIRVPVTHLEPVAGGIDTSAYNPAAEAVIADYMSRAQTLTLQRDANSNSAYYSPVLDSVTVPNVTQFKDVAEFYSTLFHELGHSTGHKSRLNRFSGKDENAAFGSESYSREELVAEITSAAILNTLGLESGNSFRNSTAYVQGWSKRIKDDPMMFVTAAGRAEKAINLILNQ